jgi:hypothetical protein
MVFWHSRPSGPPEWWKLGENEASRREIRAQKEEAIATTRFRSPSLGCSKGTSAAATTLLKTMIDPGTPASVKVRAAEAIFNHAAKAIEIEDIDARVTALEAAAANGEQRR